MSTEEIVASFAKVARPIMRQFMPRSSCIGSVKLTIEVMRLFGLRAMEIPVDFVFQVPARKYARVSGFSGKVKRKMQARAGNWRDEIPEDGGWNGHLLVMVEDRWVLDPSIDQAHSEEFGVTVGPEILVLDSLGQQWVPSAPFEARLGLILDNGDKATVVYRRIQKRDYLHSEAWTDNGLPLLAIVIAEEMNKRQPQ